MVIKGSARAAPGELAHHLLRVDTNEQVRVLGLSGVASLDLADALEEIHDMGAGSRSKRTLYHASINSGLDEQLTPQEQEIAIRRLAGRMGFENQPHVVVEHVKAGRQHLHVVWGRIDLATGVAIPDSHNYRKHEEVSRELEREFKHEQVQGAHVRDKDNVPRPGRGPNWGEQRQAERSGLTPAEAKAAVTEVWRKTATGREFQEGLETEGFTLARGDKKDTLVLVDAAGEVHGLARRIEGAKARDVRERMTDLDAGQLPDVEEARRQIALRRQLLEAEPPPEIEGTAARPNEVDVIDDASVALDELRKAMGEELAKTIAAEDRGRDDEIHGQGRGEEIPEERLTNDTPVAAAVEPPTPEARQQAGAESEKRSFWQRWFGRKADTVEQEAKLGKADSGGVKVAAPSPDASPRASYEAENQRESQKPAEPEKPRPSYNLFLRLFGAIVEAYHQAVDRAIFDRASVEGDKRRQWREHSHEIRQQPAQAREDRRTGEANPRSEPERPFDQQRRPAKATTEPERASLPEQSDAAARSRNATAPPPVKPAPPKRSWEELKALVEREQQQRDDQGPDR